jgi:1-acyl-sn-glycerol-3-phosphate acyltransferase
MPNHRSLLMLFYTIFCMFLALAGTLIDPRGRLYLRIARSIWAPGLMRLGGIDLRVTGGETLDWSRPYVVISNHTSQLDIPIIFAALRMPIRFMAKKSLFYIPLFGWSLWLAHFIPVDRSGARKARESINRAATRIRKGPSLMVFPEGTRSADGRLGSFKSGAFIMATRSGVPLLPVAIRGAYELFPRSTLAIGKGRVEVIIGSPIDTSEGSTADKDTLRRDAHDRVQTMLDTGKPR